MSGFECRAQCDPDHHNPLILTNGGAGGGLRAGGEGNRYHGPFASAACEQAHRAAAACRRSEDEGTYLSLEDAGYPAQPPARAFPVAVNAGLKGVDGQILGYTWVGEVRTGISGRSSASATGMAYGTGRRALLPFYARNFGTSGNGRQRSRFAI